MTMTDEYWIYESAQARDLGEAARVLRLVAASQRSTARRDALLATALRETLTARRHLREEGLVDAGDADGGDRSLETAWQDLALLLHDAGSVDPDLLDLMLEHLVEEIVAELSRTTPSA